MATDGWSRVAVRWLIALTLGLGGAFIVRRSLIRYQARAAARLILLDYARLEGCLYGGDAPSPTDARTQMRLLAIGTGDPLWPHSCAFPLTRLVRECEQLANDDSRVRRLAEAARHADSALAEAVFWNEHVHRGRREAAVWVDAFLALRRDVVSFARDRGMTLGRPERLRDPRRPGREEDAVRIVPPQALEGGREADVVDATATPREFAVLLRDRRGRYTVCRVPLGDGEPTVTCTALTVPSIADPRHVGFVPSEQIAHLAVWSRAPLSTRGLVDVETLGIQILVNGNPDPARDFWVSPRATMGLQVDRLGVNLIVNVEGPTRTNVLPRALDALLDDRAILGTPRGALIAWLDVRSRTRTFVRTLAVDNEGRASRTIETAATFAAPHYVDRTRRFVPCTRAGGASFVLLGDDQSVDVFATRDGRTLERGGHVSRGVGETTRLVCDDASAAIAWVSPERVDLVACRAGTCGASRTVEVGEGVAVARTNGTTLIADTTSVEHLLRVRVVGDDGSSSDATFADPPPPARDVRLVALGSHVGVFSARAETFFAVSHDAGRSFRLARNVVTRP